MPDVKPNGRGVLVLWDKVIIGITENGVWKLGFPRIEVNWFSNSNRADAVVSFIDRARPGGKHFEIRSCYV